MPIRVIFNSLIFLDQSVFLGSIVLINNQYHIHLAEQNIRPSEFKGDKLTSKRFYDEVTIQDFPLRGKACFLKVRRRKWLNESTGLNVGRDWGLVAKGTQMKEEFATFLKGIIRQSPSLSCKTIATFFHLNSKQLEHQYVFYLSSFLFRNQREHAQDWVLFEKNITSRCC